MTTPEHPVIEALEHIASNWSKNPREDAAEVLPLARELVAKAESLEWLLEFRDTRMGNCVERILMEDDCPPILKEMIEKEK